MRDINNKVWITVNSWFEFTRQVAKSNYCSVIACTASETLWSAVLLEHETGKKFIIEAKVSE